MSGVSAHSLPTPISWVIPSKPMQFKQGRGFFDKKSCVLVLHVLLKKCHISVAQEEQEARGNGLRRAKQTQNKQEMRFLEQGQDSFSLNGRSLFTKIGTRAVKATKNNGGSRVCDRSSWQECLQEVSTKRIRRLEDGILPSQG